MNKDSFIFRMFSTDNRNPSWFRVVFFAPIIVSTIGLAYAVIKLDAGMAGILTGFTVSIGGIKALQKRSEVKEDK